MFLSSKSSFDVEFRCFQVDNDVPKLIYVFNLIIDLDIHYGAKICFQVGWKHAFTIKFTGKYQPVM